MISQTDRKRMSNFPLHIQEHIKLIPTMSQCGQYLNHLKEGPPSIINSNRWAFPVALKPSAVFIFQEQVCYLNWWKEKATYLPIPCSCVTWVQPSLRYSNEKRWIISVLFFCKPKGCITFSMSLGSTSVATLAFGQRVKSSVITLPAYNNFANLRKSIEL